MINKKTTYKITSVFACVVACVSFVQGQALFNVVGNTQLKVNPNEVLFIQGGLSNSSAGTIDNEGTIYVSGDWENDNAGGGLVPTTGTVELNGSSQKIGGTNPTTFNNLSLKSSSASVKTLDQDATVGGTSGVLSLGNDALDLNTHTLTVSNPSASAITKNNGYIKSESSTAPYGTVNWKIGANNASYSVPFGSGNAGSDVAIGLTTASASGAGSISFVTYPTNSANMPSPAGVVSLSGPVEDIADRYWIVDPSGYSTNPQFSNLSFNYDESNDLDLADNPGLVEADLQAVRYNTSSGMWLDWGPSGTVNTSGNVVTVASVSVNDFYPVWTLVENTISTSVLKSSSSAFGIRNVYSDAGSGVLNLRFNTPVNDNYKLIIYDVLGRELASESIDAIIGINEMNVDLNDPSQGVYSLLLQGKNHFESRKVILNK